MVALDRPLSAGMEMYYVTFRIFFALILSPFLCHFLSRVRIILKIQFSCLFIFHRGKACGYHRQLSRSVARTQSTGDPSMQKRSITGRLILCKSNCHTFKRKGKCMSQEEEKKNNTTFWIVMIILLVLGIVGGAYVRWQFWTG